MAVLREVRTRIKSASNTQQITKAMNMVATSKYSRVVSATLKSKEYSKGIASMLYSLVASDDQIDNIYTTKREVKKVLYVLAVGNMGLCGMYNVAVANYMKKIIDGENREYDIWIVGKWGTDILKNLGINYSEKFEIIGDTPTSEECLKLTEMVCKKYTEGEFDEVHFVYEEYVNTMVQEPTDYLFLPIKVRTDKTGRLTPKQSASLIKSKPHEMGSKQSSTLAEIDNNPEQKKEYKEYGFEPDKKTVVDTLIAKYIENTVFSIMLEVRSGEHSARMTAMSNATDNTEKLLGKLQVLYNRARQEAITTEISEIVSGEAALKKSNGSR